VLGPWIALCRPRQWTKNLLVFAALLFTGRWDEPAAAGASLLAFAAMCLVSAGIYAINDARDAAADRLHPRKRLRPVAAGKVSPAAAVAFGLGLIAAGGALTTLLGPEGLLVMGAYLAVQALYQVSLKAVVLADVFAVAAGFVLRAALGAAAIQALISPWLLFCAGALALMLGFGKRRADAALLGDARPAGTAHYPLPALDALVVLSACTAAIAYGIYSIDSPAAARNPGILLTTPFVLYGIARYVMRVAGNDDVGEPADLLLTDRHIMVSLVLFVAAAVAAVRGLQVPLMER
jgi:4-hydroxybenzoate polyprenyltransferase